MGFGGSQRQGTQYGTRHRDVGVFDSEETYRRKWRGRTTPTLKTTNKQLKTYTGHTIQVVGEIQVQVGGNNTGQKVKLLLLIVRGKGSRLLGRDWPQQLRLDWHQISRVRDTPLVAEVVTRHPALSQKELGEYKGPAATTVIDPNETSRFCEARRVPYALRQRVDDHAVEEARSRRNSQTGGTCNLSGTHRTCFETR